MKPPRHASPTDHRSVMSGKGSLSERICRFCGGPITEKRRLTFCGQRCVDEWCVRSSASMARSVVLRRDKGICARCGLDCRKLERWLSGFQSTEEQLRAKRKIGLPRHRSTCWDMDHILPVKDGGGQCGLDNLQTLCWRCHAAKTFAPSQSFDPSQFALPLEESA